MEKKTDFKAMKKTELMGYIWDYYKWHIIVAIIVVVALVGTIRHFISYKDTVVQLAFVNCEKTQSEKEEEPDFTDFMEKYGYDSDREEVVLNAGYSFSLTSTSSAETTDFQSFIAMMVAGGLDVLVVDDEELYQFIGECHVISNVEQYLPEELQEKYKDDFVYVENTNTGEIVPVGIRLDKSEWLAEQGYYTGECVIGIAVGTEHDEAALQMLTYILAQ